jgi:hypothetical protein
MGKIGNFFTLKTNKMSLENKVFHIKGTLSEAAKQLPSKCLLQAELQSCSRHELVMYAIAHELPVEKHYGLIDYETCLIEEPEYCITLSTLEL